MYDWLALLAIIALIGVAVEINERKIRSLR